MQELLGSTIEVENIYFTEELEGLNVVDPNRQNQISNKELGRISMLKNPNRVLAIARIPVQEALTFDHPLVLVLDGIGDPGNLGTIIRTAKWFGVNTIICSETCAEAYNPKVVQSTMGALFHVNIQYTNLTDAIEQLKGNDFSIIGATMNGTSLYQIDKSSKSAVVIGSESHGISEDVMNACDVKATIPNMERDQKVESLNAAIASAVFLSVFSKNQSI